MKKLLSIAFLAMSLMASQAYAFGDSTNDNFNDNFNFNKNANKNVNDNVNVNFNDNSATSSSVAAAVSSSNAHQRQSQGQSQGQVNGNSNNDQTTTVNVAGDEARRIPVSTAYAPSINPTATCMGSSTAGGQGVGFGVSVGGSWESANCMYLETARSFEQAGHAADAMAIRCQTSYAKAAPSCMALVQAKTAAGVMAAVSAKEGTIEDPYTAGYWK